MKVMSVFVLLSCFAQPAFAIPDDYWATAKGTVYENGQAEERTYWTRDCDLTEAKQQALDQCQRAGADNCRIVNVRQHQCRTKCSCS